MLVPRGEAGTGSGQGLLCGASARGAAANTHALCVPPVSRIAGHGESHSVYTAGSAASSCPVRQTVPESC